jgi:hypothetical protein
MYSDTIVLSGPEVMLSSSASVAASHSPRPAGGPPQDQPPARARVDDRVGRYLVHGQDEVVEACPGQPGIRALRGHLAPEPAEIGPAEHDVQQLAAAVGDVIRPEAVQRDHARLAGHFRHVSTPPSLRLVKEMLQTVARRVRVSRVQRSGGEG